MRETATQITGETVRGGPRGVRAVIQDDLDSLEMKLRHIRRRRATLREIDDPRQRRLAEIELNQEEDALKEQQDRMRRARAQFL